MMATFRDVEPRYGIEETSQGTDTVNVVGGCIAFGNILTGSAAAPLGAAGLIAVVVGVHFVAAATVDVGYTIDRRVAVRTKAIGE